METTIAAAKLVLLCGDITEQGTDAIVNAANPGLMGGGGVDGAIHKKGGTDILKECKMIRERYYPDGLPAGQAVITTGGSLKAKKVIHAVGPVWHGGINKERQVLAQAYRNCLKVALDNGIKTISFPSISTGAYGYPVEKASKIAIRSVICFLRKNKGIEEVRFILHSSYDMQTYISSVKREILIEHGSCGSKYQSLL